jgi:arginase family enzyme
VLQPRHVALVGVRSFEAEEEERLHRLGVRVYRMDEVRARGLAVVFDEALRVAKDGTSGFGVSIDLDVLDPGEAPGVATPVPGGIQAAELASALAALPEIPSFRALELVEYTPRLDPQGATAEVALDLLAAALCGAKEEPHVVSAPLQRDDR